MKTRSYPYAALSKKHLAYLISSGLLLLSLQNQVSADQVSLYADSGAQASETVLTGETSSSRVADQARLTSSLNAVSSNTVNSDQDKLTNTDSSTQELPASKEVALQDSVTASDDTAKGVTYQAPAVLAATSDEQVLTLEQYRQMDATSLAQMVRSGKVTSQDLIKLAVEMIEKTNPELNSVISLRVEEAQKEAAALEDKGQPFLGVPILVKGLGHAIKGGDSSNGLSFLQGQTSKLTSAYVKALQKAGFIVLGQANYPEMGWINVTTSDSHGATHNPWNLSRNPGGSSGGSSAAVAIGQVPLASASDGGGSIRIPASWSGTVGFFPTLGVTAGNSLTDHGQVVNFAMTRSMEDTRALFENLLKEEVLENSLDKSQVIAYSTKTPAGTPISPDAIEAVNQAVAFLKSKGYTLEEVDYPIDGEALMKAYYAIAANSATTVNYLAKQKLKRALQKEDVELLTWALYQAGSSLSKEDMAQAYSHIQSVRETMDRFFKKYPIFLTPTNAFTAPEADYHHIPKDLVGKLKDMSGLTKEERMQLIYDQWLPAWTLTPFTQLANLTQTPAISLPTYVSKAGLPLGIMFHTYRKNDRSLLALGDLFEQAGLFQTLYNHRLPKVEEETENKKDPEEPNNSKDDQHTVESKGKERGSEESSVTQLVQVTPKRELDPSYAGRMEDKGKMLPQTGENSSSFFNLMGILSLGILALLPWKRKQGRK